MGIHGAINGKAARQEVRDHLIPDLKNLSSGKCGGEIKKTDEDCQKRVARTVYTLEHGIANNRPDADHQSGFVFQDAKTHKFLNNVKDFNGKNGVVVSYISDVPDEGPTQGSPIFTVKQGPNGEAVFVQHGTRELRDPEFSFEGMQFKEIDFNPETSPRALEKFTPQIEREAKILELKRELNDPALNRNKEWAEEDKRRIQDERDPLIAFGKKWEEFNAKPENRALLAEIRELEDKSYQNYVKDAGLGIRESIGRRQRAKIDKIVEQNPELKALVETFVRVQDPSKRNWKRDSKNPLLFSHGWNYDHNRFKTMEEQAQRAADIDSATSLISAEHLAKAENTVARYQAKINQINAQIAELEKEPPTKQ